MNLGDNRWHRKYYCDKCGEYIPYIAQKGIPVHKYYKAVPKSGVNEKSFDLCTSCENEFREWLKDKPLPNIKRTINKFPIYKEM